MSEEVTDEVIWYAELGLLSLVGESEAHVLRLNK